MESYNIRYENPWGAWSRFFKGRRNSWRNCDFLNKRITRRTPRTNVRSYSCKNLYKNFWILSNHWRNSYIFSVIPPRIVIVFFFPRISPNFFSTLVKIPTGIIDPSLVIQRFFQKFLKWFFQELPQRVSSLASTDFSINKFKGSFRNSF